MIVIDTETNEVRDMSGRRTSGGTWGAAGVLVRRRLWRDRWLVVASALVVAVATFLAYAAPHLIDETIDKGAADAVSNAGDRANITVTVPVGNPSGDNVTSVRGMPMEDFALRVDEMYSFLPPSTKSVVGGYEAWIESPSFSLIGIIDGEEWDLAIEEDRDPERAGRGGQYVTVARPVGAELDLVDGSWPEPPEEPEMLLGGVVGGDDPVAVEITVPPAFMEAFDVEIGQVMVLARATASPAFVRIVGVTTPADPTAAVWERLPRVDEPRIVNEGQSDEVVRGTIIADIFAMQELTTTSRSVFTGSMVVSVDADRVTLGNSSAIARELSELPQTSDQLLPGRSVVPRVETGLVEALEDYPGRARAAMAQMSVVIAGVVAAAAVVIALMAQLMLSRRQGDIALERARGASNASVVIRLTLESVLIAGAGVAAGYGGSLLLNSSIDWNNTMALLVAATAVVASPVLGFIAAKGTWSGRREPANRQDRAKIRKAGKARRFTLDFLALVVAVLAVVSVRGRGMLQTTSEGVDPFLAAAPVLVGLAAVVLVLRVYPAPMRVIQALARKTRGVGGVITLAKARQPIPVLPLLALTLAVAVAVSGGLIISTVRAGQETASWERVGADALVRGELTEADVEMLHGEGLTAARAYYLELANLSFGSQYEPSTLLAVDRNYRDVVAAAGVEDLVALDALAKARDEWSPGDPIPVIAHPDIIDMDVYGKAELFVGREFLLIEIIGPVGHIPEGWAGDGTYVMAPLDLILDADTSQPVVPNIALVMGDDAVDALAKIPTLTDSSIEGRTEWLARVQDSALIGGVERVMVLAVAAVAVLAGVGLLVTVLRGVSARGRALAMLRTQGLSPRWGWWLALTELAPAVLAALVGGAAAGVVTVQVLGGSLGLDVLAGGLSQPPVSIDWKVMGLLGAGILILLFVAVAVEVAAHRRDRLSDVLRYGETREG